MNAPKLPVRFRNTGKPAKWEVTTGDVVLYFSRIPGAGGLFRGMVTKVHKDVIDAKGRPYLDVRIEVVSQVLQKYGGYRQTLVPVDELMVAPLSDRAERYHKWAPVEGDRENSPEE